MRRFLWQLSATGFRAFVSLIMILVMMSTPAAVLGQTLVDSAPGPGRFELQPRESAATPLAGSAIPSLPDPGILADDLVAELRPFVAPDDPCLPRLYKDWGEVSRHRNDSAGDTERGRLRIVIDRTNFVLTLEVVGRYGDAREVYRTLVGLGGADSPTPKGSFIINHVYPYPDVMYFASSGQPIPALYNGFFAPLLVCDEKGRCERYRDMGLHGFRAAAHPDPAVRRSGARGAVSAGCIRLPDPCGFKKAFMQLAHLGPVKRNDRGSYHWLKTPVEVVIDADYPGSDDDLTVASLFEESLKEVRSGIGGLFDLFRPGDR